MKNRCYTVKANDDYHNFTSLKEAYQFMESWIAKQRLLGATTGSVRLV